MRRENNCTCQFRTNGPVKKYFDLSELLNPGNEYLDDDGSLSIEYGIQVDAIAVWHKIWQFNFKNTVFNYTGEEKQVVRCVHNIGSSPKRFFFSAEILNFHCPQYVEQAAKLVAEPGGMWTTDVDECLQILHGVQVPLYFNVYYKILHVAHTFNLSNVIRYCDRPLLETTVGVYRSKTIRFERIIQFNLKHILAEKLRNCKWKNVVYLAKKECMSKASGEIMKMFVAKILYN
ncbi:unnamed protein product [Caenorhabditis brenneri]